MQHRRLAAIMFSDIVGYTALMGRDEKQALDILKKSRRVHWRYLKKYRGKWLKEMGDGVLASFTSDADAVMCALAIQKSASELNIPLRIGIHQGDVIFEHKDVIGDGVNVASRIQHIAQSSGVVISEMVHNEIKNKEGLEIESLGQHKLKGVESPISVYQVHCSDIDKLDYVLDTGELIKPLDSWKTSSILVLVMIFLFTLFYYFLPNLPKKGSEEKKSVLVLPFDNYTGSDTLDYFVAGMFSSLTTDMGRIDALRVISETTAKAYKENKKSIAEIASELNVDYVFEGSVSCIGKDICLRLKAISADEDEEQIWVKDYAEDAGEILNVYNKITKEISGEIDIVLTPEEEEFLAQSRPVDPAAYKAFLRGMSYWELGKKEDLDRAMEHFELAKKIDPNYTLAYLGIWKTWGGYVQHGFMPYSEVLPKRDEARRKALELDSNLVEVRTGLANFYSWVKWDWKNAENEFLKAIEINSNYPHALAYYSHLLAVTGRAAEGLRYSEKALELDPLNTLYQSVYIQALKNAKQYEEALELAIELYEREPEQGIGLPAIWAVYHELGRYEEALEIAQRIYSIRGNDLAINSLESGYQEGGYKMAMQRTAEAMINISDSIYFPPWQVFTLYCRAEMKDQALTWLEQAHREHDPNMPYISADPLFDFLREDERFKDILRKMDLPY